MRWVAWQAKIADEFPELEWYFFLLVDIIVGSDYV